MLKHELAYCLGQMKNPLALPVLQEVLADLNEDPMVRHEVRPYPPPIAITEISQAAEAMGAISSESSIQILKRYLNDPNRSVRETCEIALAKIEWDSSPEGKTHHSTPTPEDRCVPCARRSLSLTR